MKKFFTVITLISAFVPAIQCMSLQNKYDNLAILIQNADIKAFKPAFDQAALPIGSINKLEKLVLQTKQQIIRELHNLGDQDKSWSKIIKGALATGIGIRTASSAYAGFKLAVMNWGAINERFEYVTFPDLLFSGRPVLVFASVLIDSLIVYTGLTYGPKALKIGWNYKKHLQKKLANINAIFAHIAQENA